MVSYFHRAFGLTVDQLLCGFLALLHQRHGEQVSSRPVAEQYFAECERQTRAQHFSVPYTLEDFQETPGAISWQSRALSNAKFPVNGRVRVNLSQIEPKAPTVIMLHALMSVSDAGYRHWARTFNHLGWNAAFVHLPFHYSRRPRGHLNGELCCTADLVLTGDTLRQAVVEIRQLLTWLRAQGSCEFGLLGTSYGGWVAALVASLEPDLRFITLLTPIVNYVHALYHGPTSWIIRGQLARAGLEPALLERHAHLSSPRTVPPAGNAAERSLIIGGSFDRIVRLCDLRAVREAWPGCDLITLPQGHFAYGMIPRAMSWLRARDLLRTK
jgi:pimeloyl-ACP methyl ester carboxylesterase